MYNSAMFWVAITTFLLVATTIMITMNSPFNWVCYVTVLGLVSVVYMIYKVLTDTYTTDKTFEDFYEDHSI
ncbi:hypothetical protein N9954_07110 [Maribacter sp.]|nr:hypothetical protein [Maribacter sp.]